MKITECISTVDKDISIRNEYIVRLNERKEKLERIQAQYPTCSIVKGNLCIPTIWDRVSCMRIERTGYYSRSVDIAARFFVGKGATVEGMRLNTDPLFSTIANLSYNWNATPKKQEITILDYRKIIPDECPKKAAFLKRIKIHLVDAISREKFTITDNSYGKDEILKLMLLR